MELKASEFGVVLSVDALKLSRQSPLGVGIGGGGGSCGGQGGGCGGCSNGCSGGNGGSGGSGSHI
ncbi:bacteriocin microcin [Escherichia coli]|uniref:microcin B17 family TOMM n=1 Tax=Escherichia coli TaxID=562 RepID=UPI00050ACCD4|nr:microcin B17 family TOMM [Escherichia coli]EFQ0894800.1 bacteriocin microcin [Shigella flexneri]EFD4990002.1 bacteriocin microcin [Escherichia coli]EFF3695217.1 bacteriocin microcin [Escherichia coli]EFG7743249.1 bacteriocin microcin [Escherichia coli]EFI5243852.1 bacteriocin microcin [Escherichia coli]